MCWPRRSRKGEPALADRRRSAPPRRRWHLWPRSLAGRTALVLLLALTVVQAAGLTIHALDRVDLQRFAQAREISQRAISAWRTVLLAPPDRRAQMLAELELPSGLSATLDDMPMARPELPPMPPPVVRLLRLDMLANSPPRFRPREMLTAWVPERPHLRGQPAAAGRRMAEPAHPPAAAAALAFRDLPDRLRRHDLRGRRCSSSGRCGG